MIAVAIVFVALGVLAAAVGIVARTHRLPGAHARPRQLPHRPAPDAAPAPGPRHRVDDAHTASYDAGAVLAELRRQSAARHADTKRLPGPSAAARRQASR